MHVSIIPSAQLITRALDSLVIGSEFGCRSEQMTLVQRIVALHVVYHKNESQVLWFGQLVFHTPGIMFHLTDETIANSSEMVHTTMCWELGVCQLGWGQISSIVTTAKNYLKARTKCDRITILECENWHRRAKVQCYTTRFKRLVLWFIFSTYLGSGQGQS